jgi:transcriptional regulator with XRE-family HTH domain
MLNHRTFGALCREWRGETTQTEAAGLLGILQSTLSKLEADQRRPTTRVIARMAEVYGLDDLDVAYAVRLACVEMAVGGDEEGDHANRS